MRGQIHVNHVLYQQKPQPCNRYRQIVVHEWDQFEVRILGGDVIQPDPEFSASSQDAEIYSHATLDAAVADAEREFKSSVNAGWKPYP
jgi:hypothetical protein